MSDSPLPARKGSSDNGGVGRPRPTAIPLPQRGHLHRLRHVFAAQPLYFITCCIGQRRALLVEPSAASIVINAFRASREIHRWAIGRYVLMPDHVHFFARAESDAKSLHEFMRDWKKWTSRQIARVAGVASPIWQPEFFDHVLRSASSYSEKWAYVRNNPVRAGLVGKAEDWPFAGEIESLSF